MKFSKSLGISPGIRICSHIKDQIYFYSTCQDLNYGKVLHYPFLRQDKPASF